METFRSGLGALVLTTKRYTFDRERREKMRSNLYRGCEVVLPAAFYP